MKKIVCWMLVLVLCLGMTSALAAGKLNIVQENFHYITGFWNSGYVYAKVENSGDKPIMINAGVMELYDEAGEVITSDDWVNSFVTYLQPGEYTYISMDESLDEGAAVPVDYMLTLTGKSESNVKALYLPVETKLELGVVDGWWEHDYMYATVTNNTDQTLYEIAVVLALLDAEGNILYIDAKELYDEVALTPGSSIVIRKDIGSDFMEYFDNNGITPVAVDALAYVQVDVE